MPDTVKDACEDCFAAHANDCSGFARAVAGGLGITLTGNADAIVDTLRGGGAWVALDDGFAAEQAAEDGKLVLAGLKGAEQANPDPHGHVVVVVAGKSLAHDAYPLAYWGRLGGGGKQNETLNFAWQVEDRDNIFYAAHDIPTGTS